MLVCFLACSWCKRGDGSSALIFKGKGQRLEKKEMGEMHDSVSPFSRLWCAATLAIPAGYDFRQCSVTMAASRTYPDSLWFSLRNHGQLQQYAGSAPRTPHGDPTCACTGALGWWRGCRMQSAATAARSTRRRAQICLLWTNAVANANTVSRGNYLRPLSTDWIG